MILARFWYLQDSFKNVTCTRCLRMPYFSQTDHDNVAISDFQKPFLWFSRLFLSDLQAGLWRKNIDSDSLTCFADWRMPLFISGYIMHLQKLLCRRFLSYAVPWRLLTRFSVFWQGCHLLWSGFIISIFRHRVQVTFFSFIILFGNLQNVPDNHHPSWQSFYFYYRRDHHDRRLSASFLLATHLCQAFKTLTRAIFTSSFFS